MAFIKRSLEGRINEYCLSPPVLESTGEADAGWEAIAEDSPELQEFFSLDFPGEVAPSPQWLLLYAQLLTSGVYEAVLAAMATSTGNLLAAAYSNLGFAIQNGAALERLQPGAGLAAFQSAINNLLALVPLSPELLAELRTMLDANGFGAIVLPQ
jgi:hypothetical protein